MTFYLYVISRRQITAKTQTFLRMVVSQIFMTKALSFQQYPKANESGVVIQTVLILIKPHEATFVRKFEMKAMKYVHNRRCVLIVSTHPIFSRERRGVQCLYKTDCAWSKGGKRKPYMRTSDVYVFTHCNPKHKRAKTIPTFYSLAPTWKVREEEQT